MRRSARTVTPEMTAADPLHRFITTNVGIYPVERNGRLGGIVSKADALKAVFPVKRYPAALR